MFARLIENIYLQRSQTKFDPLERESHKQEGQKLRGKLSDLGPLVSLGSLGSCLPGGEEGEKYSVLSVCDF